MPANAAVGVAGAGIGNMSDGDYQRGVCGMWAEVGAAMNSDADTPENRNALETHAEYIESVLFVLLEIPAYF